MVDTVLQELRSFILHVQIDQKSMAASAKKKTLKNRLVEWNAKYHQLEARQRHFKSLIILEDEEEVIDCQEADEHDRLVKRDRLEKCEEIVKDQNNKLEDSVRLGHKSEGLAR